MVATYLREKQSAAPIDLEPLNFLIQDQTALAQDINPLLIAVEFGLQGKTILISDSSAQNLYDDIRKAMLRFGVPSDRISIVAQLPANAEATSSTLSIGLKVL